MRDRIGYPRWQRLERDVPESLTEPTGSEITLVYEVGRPPVLAVRIQELFGLRETPRIAGGRVKVLLHLLAPNRRPQQVTDDLASFWVTGYAVVRKDLRMEYPNHRWPDDPTTAEPIRGAEETNPAIALRLRRGAIGACLCRAGPRAGLWALEKRWLACDRRFPRPSGSPPGPACDIRRQLQKRFFSGSRIGESQRSAGAPVWERGEFYPEPRPMVRHVSARRANKFSRPHRSSDSLRLRPQGGRIGA